MKESNKEIKLNHNALDLYNIVLDIEKYPEYLPWCKKIEIIDPLKALKNTASQTGKLKLKFL